jgi:hypothetical protein
VGQDAAGWVSTELGFAPENMRLYVDFVRWLAREELRTFSHGVAGRVDTENAVRMAESGVNLVNQIIALLRKGDHSALRVGGQSR